MRLSLHPHPDTPCGPLTGIEVELARVRPLKLQIRYVLIGKHRQVRLKLRDQDRDDPLWRHTCFEAFVRIGGEEGYLEYNLAPTGDFAAYRFDRYREGMTPAREIGSSILDVQRRTEPLDLERRASLKRAGFDTLERFEPSFFSLKAELSFSNVMGLAVAQPWYLGLSTIVEERNGRMSYWALAHPPGKPDFHDPACFALELPAARPA
ncbi:MAG TPA: DOMON-like domain-containing protein [Allosphingosinicella sp.]|nr:DOMON-like domain-containing protein [Allosphingosinicella sp.]